MKIKGRNERRFSILRWKNLKRQQSTVILDLCLKKTWAHDYREVIVFKSSVIKTYSVHTITKPTFSNSSGLKSVFEKLRLRDRLVWTVGLTKRSVDEALVTIIIFFLKIDKEMVFSARVLLILVG